MVFPKEKGLWEFLTCVCNRTQWKALNLYEHCLKRKCKLVFVRVEPVRFI